MNRREAAIIEVYTGYVTLRGDSRECIRQYASELLKRHVTDDECAREDIRAQLHTLSRKDFDEMFKEL